MKKILNFTIILLILFNFSNVAFTIDNSTKKITILHTNDIHGNFQPIIIKPKNPGAQERKLGGILALDYYVSNIRKETANVLLLDAGDFMTGNPICDIEYQGAIGGPMVRLLNKIGYDGLTLGNHEFDISIQNVFNLIKLCQFPVYSSNLFNVDGTLFTSEPYHIYQTGGLAIGVIGVIVDDLQNYINAPQRDEILVKPAAPVVDSLTKVIDPITDLIIVLSHSGIGKDKQIAKNVGPQVDVIISGHSHTTLKKALIVNKKLIVQTGSKLRNLGKLEITVVADTIQSYEYELIPLWNNNIRPDPELVKTVNFYDEQIDKEYGRVIGELLTPWRRSHSQESNIGNFITDCIRDFSGADFAVINSGGIRSNLEAGTITKLDVKNILPFANSITKFQVSGNDILTLIQLNAEASAFHKHGILQVSGLNYEWEKNGNIKIAKAFIKGKEIDKKRIYSGATVDFVVSNSEKYLGFEPGQVNNLMMPLADVVMITIEQQKEIKSKVEGRMVKK